MTRALLALALLLATLLGAAPARAVELAPAGPVTLQPDGRGFSARFTVKHDGAARSKVRLALQGGPRPLEPRTPPGLTVGFADAAESATLAPGEEREVTVRWIPPARLRSPVVYAVVEVSSADDAAPRWVAVRGRAVARPALHAALPVALILLPLLLLLAALARASLAPRLARAAGLGTAALALHGWLTVDPTASRLDGNGGAAWLSRLELSPGVELAVGADAHRLLVVALAGAALALVGARHRRASAELGVLAGAVALSLGLDVITLGLGWALLWASLAAATPDAPRLRALAALSVAAVMGGLGWFVAHAGGALALGGGLAPLSTSLAELTQLEWLGRGQALGGPTARLAALTVTGGLALCWLVAALPRWLPGGQTPVPRGTLLVLLGAAAPATGVVLVRVVGALVPEALAWMAPGLAALGALGVVVSAGAVARARDAGATAPALAGLLAALGALGLGARTSAGTAAALAAGPAMALVGLVLLGPRPWPRLALAAATLVTALVALLALGGAWPRHPLTAGVALLGFGGVMAALLARAGRAEAPDETSPGERSAAQVALVVALLAFAFPRLWLAALDAPALDHLERVDPPGPGQIG